MQCRCDAAERGGRGVLWAVVPVLLWVAKASPAAMPSATPLVAPAADENARVASVPWLKDYAQARGQAIRQRKMLLIFFADPAEKAAGEKFLRRIVPQVVRQRDLDRYVWLRLPLDAKVNIKGEQIRLIDHGAFRYMYGRQGVAVVDYAHVDAPYYQHVVSCFPFDPDKLLADWSFRVVLDLPPGTLTQRTMIYAVRVHPERPASTQGACSEILMEEAEKHSRYQAQIRIQGHHNWEARFHRINARLGGGLTCQEVVAESWAGMELVKAALDCVHAWRQSSGHWSAVRRRHRLYGYDICRGSNGVWYATGLFAD